MPPLKLSLPVAVLILASWASAGEAETKEKEKQPTGLRHVVIIQDRVPVQFEQAQIGELSEGMRVEMHEASGEWCRVRALFGQAWFEGWIRTAMTAPDSLADVPLKIAPTWPVDVYRDPFDARKDHLVPGQQLVEVRVKFEPTDKSPRRVYFSWADERTADVMLRYGRDGKSLPYGFVRRIAGMTRSTFDREEKKQTLLLTPGEATIETYVFVVPPRAREFDLVLKDVTTRVPLSRR